MDLFDQHRKEMARENAPLADRMRPRTLDEYIGQKHIIGHGRLLRRAIQIDQISSIIFYGPPGTGKTTLARIIANTTKAQFLSINAVLAGVKDIRESIKNAEEKLSLYSMRTILFIDEVHRFNKAQQDALLPHVENGTITLIGATTENPYFEVNKALVSRSRIFQLEPLTEEDLILVAKQAIDDKERGYGNRKIVMKDDAFHHLVKVANGDARGVLNALELAVETTEAQEDGSLLITRDVIEDSIQQKAVLYDKDGDAHYDTISAFIKAVRGSDPDAALYWMAKMLYAGEDPRFIFRRLLILASEDIGLADPKALGIIMDCARTFDYIGMPEGRFPLTQAVLYLSTAPKSNSTLCFYDALDTVKHEKESDVPNHLKDSSRDKEGFGHGKGYLYPHAYRDHWVAQQYLPDVLQGKTFFDPSDQGYEKQIQQDVTRRREAQIEAMIDNSTPDSFGGSSYIPDHFNDSGSWEKRTSGTTGNVLAEIRDTIFNLADLKPTDLVLDTHGKTGLLTFEAARRVTEGAVWSIADNGKSFETLTTMSQRFNAMNRPQILRCSTDEIVNTIHKEAGNKTVFNLIMGRNVLGPKSEKELFLRNILKILFNSGRIVFAETIHNSSMRISELDIFSDSDLKEKFIIAENNFFNNENNHLVNWNSNTLTDLFKKDSKINITTKEQNNDYIRRITPQDIEHWMRIPEDKSEFSLGQSLQENVSNEEFDIIKNTLHSQLDNQNIEWRSVNAFIIIKKN